MSEMKFATVGDTVKIWTSDLTQADELKNLTKPLPSICWSPNNAVREGLCVFFTKISFSFFFSIWLNFLTHKTKSS